MTTTDITTSGTRQLAVLATVAALVSMAALLFGSAISGITSQNSGLVILTIGACFLAVTLVLGWVPGLYLSILMVTIGSIFVGERIEMARAVILALTIIVIHESARFSLDARKPTRLGAGLLLRTSLGGGLAIAVVAVVALVLEPVSNTEPSAAWVPIGLAAIAVPLLALRGAELLTNRISISAIPSAVIGGVLAIAVVTTVATGAQNREDVTDSLRAGDSTVVSERAEAPPPFYPEAVSGGLATLIGMFVGAGILGLLYGAFHREQILLEQDDIELDLDDARFALSFPDTADIEDVGLDVEATRALLASLVGDLDNEPDPGRAIRFAYAKVEQQLAALGIERSESETAHEFMGRALPVLGDGSSLSSLTTLFERARFSDKPVPEAMREDARSALTSLQGQIETVPLPTPEDDDEPGTRESGVAS